MSKTLGDLFAEFPLPILRGIPGLTRINRIVADSRLVEPGDLFVATKGESFNAHKFIPDVIRKGAVAVVGSDPEIDPGVPYILVPNSRQALAYLSAAYYDYPARKLTIIGVTGTDGKTTTCNLLHQILVASGIKTGMISTVSAVIGDDILDTGLHVTTPDSPDIQRLLSRMVNAGITHVVLETTSHGWAQFRVDACEIDIGIVTNITHEHLDEHGSYENYRAAKARLFESLKETRPKIQGNPRLAVLNRDDRSFSYLSQIVSVNRRTYGFTPNADVHIQQVEYGPSGINFVVMGDGWQIPIACPLIGAFNVSNCLAALTAAICGLGIDPVVAASGIANFSGIPGRMERIDLGQNFTAIVDFAHTPNALKNAIETIRQIAKGRVIVIFGSAGLRDRQKRRMMAEISAQLADISILTAEDPRTESLEAILEEMAQGAISQGGKEGETFWRVPDRGDAIRLGLSLAAPEDVVMACGKGHEQSMCFGETEYPWDDRTAMKAALAESLGVVGPKMPFLPTQR